MKKAWYRNWLPRSHDPVDVSADHEVDADLQFSRGLKFASEGTPQDYVQAAVCYRKAADQGHSLAQFNLGVMYAQGQGIARDEAQSVVWFDKAARGGDGAAQFNLGKSCHRASLNKTTGPARELRTEAYKWFQLAAAQGYQGSDAALNTLILTMTREEVTEGNRRVAGLRFEVPKYRPGAVILSVILPQKPAK